MKIILLDLNATYVENTEVHNLRYGQYNVQAEHYRSWLTKIIKGYPVIMITARPERYRMETLHRIKQLEGWQPMEAYFNDSGLRAPEFKDMVLRTKVFPKHGKHGEVNRYVALESNSATRLMYWKHHITAYTQEQVRLDSSIIEPMTLL